MEIGNLHNIITRIFKVKKESNISSCCNIRSDIAIFCAIKSYVRKVCGVTRPREWRSRMDCDVSLTEMICRVPLTTSSRCYLRARHQPPAVCSCDPGDGERVTPEGGCCAGAAVESIIARRAVSGLLLK
ncbi:hypothetical protein O3G_MSEX008833 [Manduca sexta]|uniref:Uncharacterized protein n=1 Tax=Manduca sexta TaxID=7130 RepID=A0A921ZBZ0_MANSE|nr:hypothetical protein O3G_MSEX008833 [Manduca sexta]